MINYFILFLSVCIFWAVIHNIVVMYEIKRDVNIVLFYHKLADYKEKNNAM